MPAHIERLTEPHTGSTAEVAVHRGFNCFKFVAIVNGTPGEVLWAQDDFVAGGGRAAASGVPILFPFASRIRSGRFSWQGRTYQLEPNDGLGNAIHGLVLDRPWRLVDRAADSVVGQFQLTREAPDLAPLWPTDFLLQVEWRLAATPSGGASLSCKLRVENPSDIPLPYSLGLHPWFRLPLGAVPGADSCRIYVPASETWELENLLPTGKKQPVSARRDLRGGQPFAGLVLDDVFTGLAVRGDRWGASIADPANHRRLALTASALARACVVYTPPHRQAICIEPYTSLPDPFEAYAHDWQPGLLVLAPGDSADLRVDICLDAWQAPGPHSHDA